MSHKLVAALTLMTSGRAMTLAFVARAGDGGAGDPPAAWLMPLVGDAVIGVTAVAVAFTIWRHRTPTTWLIALIWSALAIFDALAAFVVETSVPWPEFFMLEIFGRSMFLAAVALHGVIFAMLVRPDGRTAFGVDLSPREDRVGAPST